ncbi:hypothetical protein DH09_01095 (plasmid) [Bacillaceae bacterium JMAK1]|nr:hypothetical protein DH09_01095 [Bacillaceae bacterium JMAK1]
MDLCYRNFNEVLTQYYMVSLIEYLDTLFQIKFIHQEKNKNQNIQKLYIVATTEMNQAFSCCKNSEHKVKYEQYLKEINLTLHLLTQEIPCRELAEEKLKNLRYVEKEILKLI